VKPQHTMRHRVFFGANCLADGNDARRKASSQARRNPEFEELL
jgi:hypothetical protein